MERLQLKEAKFKKLKGLNNAHIKFSDTLTAIMGVNGAGKTTVIHALSCIYQPDGNGEDHKFPEFFVPNTDALWNGSNFTVTNFNFDSNVEINKEFSKQSDRWKPRYQNRLKRNVYYIGIDTCLPEIEKTSKVSHISYKSKVLSDTNSSKNIKIAAYILNKDYESLIENKYDRYQFSGVKLKNGLKYSALSMGSGEQRIIKILEIVQNAEAYSLILIDEIDLLLHVSALKRLIVELHKIAKNKHMQIVFTTHSLEMINLYEFVSVQYIGIDSEENSIVFDRITEDLIYMMSDKQEKKYSIYVEDNFAKAIVKNILRANNVSLKYNVIKFGAIENAFTLASSFVIKKDDLDKQLIILDGDRYITESEKLDQIKRKLSGTEKDADLKRHNAMSIITEFKLPECLAPEQFIHEVILRCFPKEDEIFIAASEIRAVRDSHEWIGKVCEKLDIDEKDIANSVFKYASDDEVFTNYVNPIKEWILSHEKNEICI